MLSVLATGQLVRDPQSRTSSVGKPYVTALLRVPCEDGDPLLCSVIAFSPDAVQALLALAKGDAVAVAGRAKMNTWEKDGESRTGLSIVADQVLTAYQVEKRRQRVTEEPAHA